ncbi:MAG: response regulator [Phycisphaerales bacterium]|nr:response regulator [Phycisphaerales bacterium]
MSHAVLIVDDEQQILRSLKRLLRRDGYEIHLADNGPSALEILAETEIAAIICDQRMPGMSGAEVLAEAYKLRPDTLRITLTGYTDLAAAQKSINEGHIHQFLLKPWDDDNLRSVVKDAVGAYQLVVDHRKLEALSHKQKEQLEAWNKRLEAEVRDRTEQLRAQNEHLLQLQRRVEQSLRDTVGVLAGTLEASSPNLGIHCKRVAQLARQMAIRLELDANEIMDIEFAAHLHDLGKLSKPTTTNALPTDPVDHTEVGYAILSKVSGFEKIAIAVRHQNEHFDGSGGPENLEGHAIPLASRIIAIVNAYDQAVYDSENPTDISHAAGKEAIQDGQGKKFDPELVELLVKHMGAVGTTAGREVEVEISPKKTKDGMVLARPIRNLDGVLLINEGVRLTPKMIDRIRSLSHVDPLLASVFVIGNSLDAEDEDGESGQKPLQDSQPTNPLQPAGPTTAGNDSTPRIDTRSNKIPPTSPARGKSIVRRKILVVDDSKHVCSAIKRELRPLGIEVVATDNGTTAISLAENTRFEVALVDLMMPVMPGEEVVRRLRERAPKLKCIILTGNATKDTVMKLGNEPNVVGFLTKPWDHQRLLEAISASQTKPESTKQPV